MLLHPLLTVANAVLAQLSQGLSFIQGQTLDIGPLVVPWPFPFLPPGPAIGAMAIGVFGLVFFLGLKTIRWIYGLTPFVQ